MKWLHKKQRLLDADKRRGTRTKYYPRSSAFIRVQSNDFGYGLSELGVGRKNRRGDARLDGLIFVE